LPDFAIRAKAELADRLASLAMSQKNSALQLEALWKAFDYSPSLDRLIRWFERTDQGNDAQAKAATWQAAIDRLQTHPSNTLRGHALLISGRLLEALDLCSDQNRTDSSAGIVVLDDLVLGYFLKALAKGGPFRAQIDRIWQHLVVESSVVPLIEAARSEDSKKIYDKLANQAFSKHTLSPQQMNRMLEWAISQVDLRIAPILAQKHRSTYPFAAQLVIALIETMLDQNKISPVSDYLGNIKPITNVYQLFRENSAPPFNLIQILKKVLSSVTGNGV